MPVEEPLSAEARREELVGSIRAELARGFAGIGAPEPDTSVLRVEARPTFGVGSVRMPRNELVTVQEGAPSYKPPIETTVRFVELCRDFLIPVLERVKVKVNDEEVEVPKPVKQDGKFLTEKKERCFNRVVPEPVLACTTRLADHIEGLTPEAQRTALTRTQSEVEGFYACTDESENTYIASAVLERPRTEIKQVVSQLEIPFIVKVPAAGLSEEEAVRILDNQRKRAAQRAARGEPVLERAIDPVSGRTVDQWGLPSYIISPTTKAENRDRYCPPFNQTVGCVPPIPRAEPPSEEAAITISPEELEIISARQAAVQLPELPAPRPPPPAPLPAIEVLSPEAQRVLTELARRERPLE